MFKKNIYKFGKKITTILISLTCLVAMPVSAADPITITVMGYRNGGFQENYIKAVVEPFMKENPEVTVKFYGVQNAGGMLGLMRAQKSAPQIDAAIFDLSVAKIAKAEGLITPVDLNAVPNYSDLQDVGRELGLWAPPLTYDTLALIYNKNAFPVAPSSWKVMWEKKYERKVVVPAQGGGDIQAIALTLIANRMAGETNYQNSFRPGVDSIVRLAPNIMTWEPKPDAYTLVANGSAQIGIGWNARSQLFVDLTDGKLGVVTPSEGTVSQVNIISQISGGKNSATTQAFINYALSPEAQKAFSELMFYAPTNSKVQVNEATRYRIPLLNKKVAADLIPVDWLVIADMRESILDAWRRQIIPASR
jgi:putative spermidine/putrescine transport system substrate-binding protein